MSWATLLLFSGVLVWRVVLRVRCPGPPGCCSPVCPLGVLCCVCGVLGHVVPAHWCGRLVCCVAVRCPGPLGSCSPVPPLSSGTWLLCTAVLARCVVLCAVCALSWGTWLLFTGVPARRVVLCVRCPWSPGSCSPVCLLGVLCCVCGVLGHLAPFHRCARLVCCVVCAVSWATWALFTGVCARSARCVACAVSQAIWLLLSGVPARRVVFCVRCPGRTGSCSPVCSLGLFCCVRGVLGHLAPVHRCARSVCCTVCCACGVLGHLAPVHRCARWLCCLACVARRCGARTRPSGRLLFVAGRGLVPSGRAHVHPDGDCFVAGRGWVRCRGRTRPSGRRLFRSRQGLGSLPGAHTSIWTTAGIAWHLFACRGLLRVVRASRGCGNLWPLLLGTCRCALVVAGGVPLRRALSPCMVHRASSGAVALGSHVRFPDDVVLFPSPAAFGPGFTGRLRGPGRSRPRTGLIVPAAGLCRGKGAGRAPRCKCSGPGDLAGPSGVGLVLCALPWLACVDPVIEASGFPYRPSSDGGLARCTGAVSCGRRHLPFQVRGRQAWVPCVCVCVFALLGRVGRAGLPGAFWCASPSLWPLSPSALLGTLRGGVALSCLFVCLPPLFFPVPAPPRSLAFSGFRPRVSWDLALPDPGPRSFSLLLFFPSACLVRCLFPSTPLFLFPPPLPLFVVFSRFFCLPILPCLFCGSPAARLSVCSFVSFFFFFGVLCCAVWRLRVVPCLWSRRRAALFWSVVTCAVLCCAVSLHGMLRRGAARRSIRRCAVLCRVVLFRSSRAVACCVVPSGAVRRPVVLRLPELCFVVFPRAVCSVLCLSCRGVLVRAVVRRCALCCVCVLSVSWGVVLRIFCPLRSVWCCAVLRRCACSVLFVWFALFAVPGAVVHCCVLCRVLWCSVVRKMSLNYALGLLMYSCKLVL